MYTPFEKVSSSREANRTLQKLFPFDITVASAAV